MSLDGDYYRQRHAQLKSGRTNWESHWNQIAEVIWPDAAQFIARKTPGTKLTQKVFDSTATRGLDRHSSLMMALNTPPTQRWQMLRPEDTDLAGDAESADWMEELSLTLFRMRDAKQSGYYSALHQVYKSMGAFGTAALFVDGKPGGGIQYRAISMSELCIDVDQAGVVDTIYRKYPLTARAAVQRWGEDKLSQNVRAALKGDPNQTFEFLHVVHPRADYDPDRADAKGMLFEALEISLDDGKVLDESGYHELPYMTPRFTLNPGEMYGRSPAMTILPDVLTLNDMAKTFLKAGHKAVSPPILLADDNIMGAGQSIDMRPDAYNYGAIDDNGRPKMLPFNSGARLDLSLEMMERLVRAINEAFMVVVWEILIEKPDMTATEVMVRAREKGQILTPLVAPVKDELLDPSTDREIGLILRQGRMRPPPQQLQGAAIRMAYQTESTRLQRTDELMSVQGMMQDLAPFAATNPSIYSQLIDPIKLGKLSADVRSVPRSVLVSDEERAQIRQAQDQAQQDAQLLDAAPGLAGGLRDVAEAGKIFGENRAA